MVVQHDRQVVGRAPHDMKSPRDLNGRNVAAQDENFYELSASRYHDKDRILKKKDNNNESVYFTKSDIMDIINQLHESWASTSQINTARLLEFMQDISHNEKLEQLNALTLNYEYLHQEKLNKTYLQQLLVEKQKLQEQDLKLMQLNHMSTQQKLYRDLLSDPSLHDDLKQKIIEKRMKELQKFLLDS